MCGIFGIAANHGNPSIHRPLAERLFGLSESRGVEASGFAFTKNGEISVYKEPVRGTQILKSPAFSDIWKTTGDSDKPFVFIGHSRLATNGPQGDNRNNQPVSNTDAVCVHNGIIVNIDRIWKSHPKLTRRQEVDTEIFPAYISRQLAAGTLPSACLAGIYGEIEGAASLAVLLASYRMLYLATNTGSLYWTGGGGRDFLFASERYILAQTIPGTNHPIHRLEAGNGLTVDPDTGAANVFPLTGRRKRIPEPERHTALRVTDTSGYAARSFSRARLNSQAALKKHVPDEKAIAKIRRCTRCILPETMPMITFDDRGVCNFCRTYTSQNPQGDAALKTFVRQFRKGNGKQDCIVALSGGRDSSYGLHYFKTVLGMNPIAYTYDWGMVTDVARRNQSRMTAALGVEHVIVSADIGYKLKNIKENISAWLAKPDIAMVPLFMAGDKQAEYYIEELKKKTGITLVIYSRGNQLEDERFKFGYYGIFDGTPKGVIHNLSPRGKLQMAAYFARACLINPRYINSSLVDTAFAYATSYLIPHRDFVYLWHYIPWNENEVVGTLKKKYGWESAPDTKATWRIDDGTPPFYNYIYYRVQGFTEHDGLRSNQIRENTISRKDALELVREENKPRYESLAWYFDRIGLDGDMALSVVDAMKTQY